MKRRLRKIIKYLSLIVIALIAAGTLYGWVLYRNIRNLAVEDHAHAADAIVILGAAQYNGRPSPVLKARLDHALELYNKGYVHAVITTGGYGPDPNFSEAHVSAKYLEQQGVDAENIITEQGSGTTRDSIRAAVALLQSNGWTSTLVVSDGFHMYRVKRMFEDAGIEVYTSPAPDSPIENAPTKRYWYTMREVLLFCVYRVFNL